MPLIKETSDSLSQPLVEAPSIVVAPAKRTVGDYVALAVATFGVGFIPIAPGTWGSAVGVVIYFALGWSVYNSFFRLVNARDIQVSGPAFQLTFTAALLIVIVVLCLVGTWAATRTEKLLRRKDPGVVVVDEVAGQLIAFVFVPWGNWGWPIVAGFIAFRVFDIWKPYPIRRLEALESGLGVMADDVLAGAYAATLMALIISAYTLFLGG